MASARNGNSRSRSRSPDDSIRDDGGYRDRTSESLSAEPEREERERASAIRHRHHRQQHHQRRHHHYRHDSGRTQRQYRDADKVKSAKSPLVDMALPYEARQLTKQDLSQLSPLFAMYLDIQKGLILEELPEREVKGRWKSFVARWNRGELAEGWYDPTVFEKASKAAGDNPISKTSDRQDLSNQRRNSAQARQERESSRQLQSTHRLQEDNLSSGDIEKRIVNLTLPQGEGEDMSVGKDLHEDKDNDDDGDDDDYGPRALSSEHVHSSSRYSGPTLPKTQDLVLQRESAYADRILAGEEAYKQRRAEIQSHKAEMRTIQDEVTPRAEPGTHERRVEKRRETAAVNRDFARARRGDSPAEAGESDLMGGGDDLDALKIAREQHQRKKNEREIRREAMLQARAAEREERLQKYRKKEEKTMGWLKALANQRFG